MFSFCVHFTSFCCFEVHTLHVHGMCMHISKFLKTGSLDNAIQEFSLAKRSLYMSNIIPCSSKVVGVCIIINGQSFLFLFFSFYILQAFLMIKKQYRHVIISPLMLTGYDKNDSQLSTSHLVGYLQCCIIS